MFNGLEPFAQDSSLDEKQEPIIMPRGSNLASLIMFM